MLILFDLILIYIFAIAYSYPILNYSNIKYVFFVLTFFFAIYIVF